MHALLLAKAAQEQSTLGHLIWRFIGLAGNDVFYFFWSAFGSVVVPMLVYVPTVLLVYWHHTCVAKKSCWRWARHEYDMDGVKHKLCHVHHPALQGKRHRFEDFLLHHQSKQASEAP